MVDQLFMELSKLPEVEAIALGGSRAGKNYDEKSDYDVYLYCKSAVSEDVRSKILSKYCSRMEIGNHFWEYEDNCTLNDGIDIDLLYRNLDDFTNDVASVVEEYQARNGYTTCMWHNLIACKVIYEIAKAVKRNELVSINHRVAAFMESYFDMIFAINELTQPGEKRLMQICGETCKILPAHFHENLNKLFEHLYVQTDAVAEDLTNIINRLEEVL